MAGGQERGLKRRIKSVQSTKKITRAMELIAASRVTKAQQRVAAARPYAEGITEVVRNLSAAGAGRDQPLLTPRETVSTVGVVVITADRGLAGGYNAAVIRLAESVITKAQAEGLGYQLFVCGKKGVSYFRYRDHDITESFTGFSEQPGYEDARRVATAVVERFEAGDVDRVELAYTQFFSMGSQKPQVHRFIPLEADAAKEEAAKAEGHSAEYEYEPGPNEILERLLPRYVEARLFAAMLDAAASELASRQRAMKAATDNATDLITTLERQMNRARQDSITTEIIEIASGAEALAEGSDGADKGQDAFMRQSADYF